MEAGGRSYRRTANCNGWNGTESNVVSICLIPFHWFHSSHYKEPRPSIAPPTSFLYSRPGYDDFCPSSQSPNIISLPVWLWLEGFPIRSHRELSFKLKAFCCFHRDVIPPCAPPCTLLLPRSAWRGAIVHWSPGKTARRKDESSVTMQMLTRCICIKEGFPVGMRGWLSLNRLAPPILMIIILSLSAVPKSMTGGRSSEVMHNHLWLDGGQLEFK